MRPQSITVLCVVLLVISISLALRSLAAFGLEPGFFSFVNLAISLGALWACYGLWKMRRWSIFVFFGIWGLVLLLTLFSPREVTTIVQLRALYPLAIILVFSIVVLPHGGKFSPGPTKESGPEQAP